MKKWIPSVSISIALANVSFAQSVSLEEVIVTAQKRVESSQSTPISLAVFGSVDLENKGISSVLDLKAAIPNLHLTTHPNSTSTARIFIRGVGNNDDQVTQDPSVALYLDGIYLARSQGLATDVADLERVEVLRGPQGSLYGRNATGGAINFITKAPILEEVTFKQELGVGSRNLVKSKTQINIPIGQTSAIQAGFLKTKQDGFVKNEGTGVNRFGDKDREAYRLSWLWEPNDQVNIQYSYDRSEINDSPGYGALVPLYPKQGSRPSRSSSFVSDLPLNDTKASGHSLIATWELTDRLTLKSISSYRELEDEAYQAFHPGIQGPDPILINDIEFSQDQFSQELHLIGSALNDSIEYVVGVFYFDESGESFDTTTLSYLLPGGQIDRSITLDNKASAAFGQLTYTPDILDNRLHFTVGSRYSRDKREATLDNTTILSSGMKVIDPSGHGSNRFSNTSSSVVVAYDLSNDINTYFKIAEGYKTGGYNIRASSVNRFNNGFDEETLVSYELGVKSEWLENRLRANISLFHANYKDIQVNVQSDPALPTVTDVLNAGKAEIEGVEVDITYKVSDQLTTKFNYAYLNPDFTSVKSATGENIKRLYSFTQQPQHTYTLELEYKKDVRNLGTLSIIADYYWEDEKNNSPVNLSYITDDYGLVNARINLENIPVLEGFRFGLWAKNIGDKEYYIDHFNALQPTAYFGDPRSFGLDVVYEY